MLQIIRDWVKGWLAIIIIALLIIPFAFWGINYYFGQGGEIIAISVNDKDISVRQYQRMYQTIRQQWQAISEGKLQDNIDDLLKQQTLESLIQRELLSQANKSAGLRVSNEQVRETIKNAQAFQSENGFDQLMYENSIAQLGLTPVGFEAQVRQDLLNEQLQFALLGSVFVTRAEAEQYALLKYQTRDISYALISSDDIKEGIEVTNDDINKYYQQQGDQFQEPEKVRIAYIVLSLQKIADGVDVDEQALLAYYENNKASYSVEEQRKVNQLLIKIGENPSPEQNAIADKFVLQIKGLLQGGKTLREVAEHFSEEPEIAIEFSEFGYLTRGIMEPEVDDVAFKLDKGVISDPIHSKYGIHIIEVTSIKGGETEPFDRIRSEVEQDFKLAQAEERFFELTDRMAALAYEQPNTLEVAADEVEAEIQTSDFFSRDNPGPGLISDPKILSASFSDEVLLNGNNSDVIELDNNRNVVLRVIEHQAATTKPLQEVRDRITTRIKYERAREQARKKGEKIITELKQGSSRDAVAGKYSIDWKDSTGVKRDDEGTNRSVLRTAFRAGKPQDGKPLYSGISLGSGDYAVIMVSAVHDVQADSLKQEDIDNIRTQLQQMRVNARWLQFNKDMKQRADIVINTNSL